MASKGAKLARKRAQRGGHNKREGVVRYDSGRIDYSGTEKAGSAMATAIGARVRMYSNEGVFNDNANTAKAGTVFGRMCLQGEITDAQYQAGREFDRRRHAYLQAISAPPRPRSGSDIGYVSKPDPHDVPDEDKVARPPRNEEEYTERCNEARRRYAEVRREALEADPFAMMALETIVCEDKLADSLAGALRVGCNAIARLMKIERGKA